MRHIKPLEELPSRRPADEQPAATPALALSSGALLEAADVLAPQRHAGNAAVCRRLARQAAAPTTAAKEEAKAPEAKPAGPSEEDKTEFALFKGEITDTTVEAYVERRRKEFGDKEGSDTEYKTYAATADKEFEGIKTLVGQAEDSMERRKVLYRWLRKAYEEEGITDAPATIEASMTPEMKKKLDAVKDTRHPEGRGLRGAPPEDRRGLHPRHPLRARHGQGRGHRAQEEPAASRRRVEVDQDLHGRVARRQLGHVEVGSEGRLEGRQRHERGLQEEARGEGRRGDQARRCEPCRRRQDRGRRDDARACRRQGRRREAPAEARGRRQEAARRQRDPARVLRRQRRGARVLRAPRGTRGGASRPGPHLGATFTDVDLHHFEMD